MSEERFKVRDANDASDEDMAVLQEIASRIDTMLMFLDSGNAALLQRRAQEADVDPGAWLIRALNLQADVDAGRVSATREMSMVMLPLEDAEPLPASDPDEPHKFGNSGREHIQRKKGPGRGT